MTTPSADNNLGQGGLVRSKERYDKSNLNSRTNSKKVLKRCDQSWKPCSTALIPSLRQALQVAEIQGARDDEQALNSARHGKSSYWRIPPCQQQAAGACWF